MMFLVSGMCYTTSHQKNAYTHLHTHNTLHIISEDWWAIVNAIGKTAHIYKMETYEIATWFGN